MPGPSGGEGNERGGGERGPESSVSKMQADLAFLLGSLENPGPRAIMDPLMYTFPAREGSEMHTIATLLVPTQRSYRKFLGVRGRTAEKRDAEMSRRALELTDRHHQAFIAAGNLPALVISSNISAEAGQTSGQHDLFVPDDLEDNAFRRKKAEEAGLDLSQAVLFNPIGDRFITDADPLPPHLQALAVFAAEYRAFRQITDENL